MQYVNISYNNIYYYKYLSRLNENKSLITIHNMKFLRINNL